MVYKFSLDYFYQYDENNILKEVSFRTKTQCIKFLEIYNASKMDEVVEGYIEYLKKLKYLNDLLNYG